MNNNKKKIVLNLSDVNKESIFVDRLPDDILFYHSLDKTYSMFMVENAQSVVDRINYFSGKSPNPKPRKRK